MIRGVVQLVGALVGVIALMVVCTIVIGVFREPEPPPARVFDTPIGEIKVTVKVKTLTEEEVLCMEWAIDECGGCARWWIEKGFCQFACD